MTKIVYEVVRHDHGWVYRVGDSFSETYPSHDDARRAAEDAARRQSQAGDTESIEYQDEAGSWHEETAPGDDRPDTEVRG
jgi:hypothetical protein